MILKSLSLQNFRSYKKSGFNFSAGITLVIGQNGIGKTNLIEAIFLLASGKSWRAEKEKQLIQFGNDVCRIIGETRGPVAPHPRSTSSATMPAGDHRGPPSRATPSEQLNDEEKLEIVFVDQGMPILRKKYQVNGVAKRRSDFAGHLTVVLFTPQDLDLVSGQPSNRRRFLDEVLEQVDVDYLNAHALYTKALRQRNALLQKVQETGIRNEKLFTYWDELLIKNGNIITEKREGLLNFINARQKEFFSFILTYDHSMISQERLLKYKEAEVGAGVTLVGPHRDDIKIQIANRKIQTLDENSLEAKYFASRGQQRLVVLELKLAQIAYLKEKAGAEPLLLLDDIFSELDSSNIQKVISLIGKRQVIITTTHKEFMEGLGLPSMEMIELGK